jgi:hypothetical protein
MAALLQPHYVELSPPEMETLFCRCDQRSEATVFHGFRFDAYFKGWVFPGDKPRVVADPWRSTFYGLTNHDGEPVVWVDCPFCGHVLPFIDAEQPPPADFCSDDAN